MQGLNLFSFYSSDLNILPNHLQVGMDINEEEGEEEFFNFDQDIPIFTCNLSESNPIEIEQSKELDLKSVNLTNLFIEVLNQAKSDFLDLLESGKKEIQASIIGSGELKLYSKNGLRDDNMLLQQAQEIKRHIDNSLVEGKLVVAVLSEIQEPNEQQCCLEIKLTNSLNPSSDSTSETIRRTIMKITMLPKQLSGAYTINLQWKKILNDK